MAWWSFCTVLAEQEPFFGKQSKAKHITVVRLHCVIAFSRSTTVAVIFAKGDQKLMLVGADRVVDRLWFWTWSVLHVVICCWEILTAFLFFWIQKRNGSILLSWELENCRSSEGGRISKAQWFTGWKSVCKRSDQISKGGISYWTGVLRRQAR